MNNQIAIYFWLVSPVLEPKTWTKDNINYLLFRLQGKKDENAFLFFPPGDAPLLIIPDDNSSIVNQIKNRQKDDYFTTSFANLKLKRDFLKGGHIFDPNNLLSGLLVKDFNQLEKVSENRPLSPEITFKVIKQFKEGFGFRNGSEEQMSYQESFSKYGDYTHILEIEPLELGIEGMSPITKIIFQFAEPTQRVSFKPLTKSKLYKSAILTESVGKTFTMRVKSWNWRSGFNTLTFRDDWDFEFDSFQEKTANGHKPTNSTPSNPQTKDFLVISGIVGGLVLIFLALLYFRNIRNRKRPKK